MLEKIIEELTQSKTTRSRTLKNGATITWMPGLKQFSAHRFDVEIDEQERVTFQKQLNKAGFTYGRPERSAAFDLNQSANRYTVTWNIARDPSAGKRVYERGPRAKAVKLPMFAEGVK